MIRLLEFYPHRQSQTAAQFPPNSVFFSGCSERRQGSLLSLPLQLLGLSHLLHWVSKVRLHHQSLIGTQPPCRLSTTSSSFFELFSKLNPVYGAQLLLHSPRSISGVTDPLGIPVGSLLTRSFC